MQIKILGAHNVESRKTRLTSFLIDGVLALDAGGLTASLSLAQQEKIKAIILTHCHFDHVRDIATIGLNVAYPQKTIAVYSMPSTLEVVSTHLIDGTIYPRLTEFPSAERPALRFYALAEQQIREIEGYQVLPVKVNHSVPTVAYQIGTAKGSSLFYSGDTGPGLGNVWPQVSPQLLFIEVSVPNRLEQAALRSRHLTPGLLRAELAEFKKIKGYLPPVVLVHLNPIFEKEIGEEAGEVAKELATEITLGFEGMRLSL